MILKINGKIAAKTLAAMNSRYIVCVNSSFFENAPKFHEFEYDCYGQLTEVVNTGCIEGLKVEEIVLDWFKTEQKRIEDRKLVLQGA
jgi:hypothetical protein